MSESTTKSGTFWMLIVVAAGVALAARTWDVNSRALNFDEVYEVTHCRGSLAETVQEPDGMPPTYHLLLARWIEWFGPDVAARWLSVAFGIAAVVVTGLWGRSIGGDRTGWIAALLLAVSSMHVYHSQEARGYSMLCFFVALVLLFGWKLLTKNGWLDWALFAAASWLAAATHYYAAVPVALMWLYVGLARPERIWPRGVIAAGVLAICLAPIIYCFWIDLKHNSGDFPMSEFHVKAWGYTYLALVGGYSLGPPINELRDLTFWQGVLRMLPYASAIATCGLPITVAAVRAPERRADAYRLLGLLLGAVLLLGVLTRLAGTGYIYRYVAWLVVPTCVFLALGLDVIASRKWRLLLTGGLLAISCLSIVNWHVDQRYWQDDFHSVARLLDKEGPDAPVLSVPSYFAQAATYHLAATRPVISASALSQGPQNWHKALPELAKAAQNEQHFWIVAQWLPHDDPRLPVRHQLLELLQAEPVAQITTVMVYRASVERLQEVVDQLPQRAGSSLSPAP